MPSFFLYGEPPRADGDAFVNVEALAVRSRAEGWTIRPHAHLTLAQVFTVRRGGGTVLMDGVEAPIRAPALLVVPPGAIHGFAWRDDIAGHVLTIGRNVMGGLAAGAPEFGDLFERPVQRPLHRAADRRRLDMLMRLLAAELAWQAPAHRAAVESLLTLLLVSALRAVRDSPTTVEPPGHDAVVVARFRAAVEQRFREGARLPEYLAVLGVSERRLRTACARVAHRTPLQIVHDRTMLEARRMLLASNRTAAEIAYTLGFQDPAYFSRVFHAAEGVSARDFRRRVANNGTAPT